MPAEALEMTSKSPWANNRGPDHTGSRRCGRCLSYLRDDRCPIHGDNLCRSASCHPERKHYAHGECRGCYMKTHSSSFPSSSPLKQRQYKIASKYGVREEEIERQQRLQGGVCAICLGNHLLVIDHNHQTRQFRGLLCGFCNSYLGIVRDRVDLLERAIAYLRGTLYAK